MTRRDRMIALLEDAFKPALLDVRDDSPKHAGHAGYGAGESHYHLTIRSQVFAGMSRVEIQRQVLAALKPEFDLGLHALSMDAKAE